MTEERQKTNHSGAMGLEEVGIQSPGILDIHGVDMYLERGKLITKVPLPEFNKDEIDILATGDGLEISAMRRFHSQQRKDRRYYMQEGRQSYWRHLGLPKEAEPEKLRYYFKNGRLTVVMPMALKEGSKGVRQ